MVEGFLIAIAALLIALYVQARRAARAIRERTADRSTILEGLTGRNG